MEFNLLFGSFFMVALVILVPCANARDVPGEALVAVLKEETVNEAILDLVGSDASLNRRASLPTSETMCNDHPVAGQGGSKRFSDNIEPRPDVTSYRDEDMVLKGKKHFTDDIEPRPDITAYGEDDVGLKGNRFTNDFDPRPDATKYEE